LHAQGSRSVAGKDLCKFLSKRPWLQQPSLFHCNYSAYALRQIKGQRTVRQSGAPGFNISCRSFSAFCGWIKKGQGVSLPFRSRMEI
jgi:hypothetical protein